ncbi:unnamed protein product [Anisakis simplex]|uniref:Conserved domain protein n=1 Tax=Anisakis simplex TaxID=6269 RepID=A0A0M3JYF9_ANISI|nr:unnamed protein product [Anisakis simplex]
MKPAESTDKSDDRQSVKDPQSNNAQTAQHSEREGDAMDPATMSTCTVADKHHSYRMFPSFRFAVGIMLAAAFFCATSMRADLGMAMVCMVNATAFTPDKPVNWTKNIDKSGVCQADGTTDNMVNAGYNVSSQSVSPTF